MDLKNWCKNQAEEAKKYKWCKGVELGKDPGEQAIAEWVNKYAYEYRKEYNQCLRNITNIVFMAVQSKVTNVDEPTLRKITELVIEEFTKEWTKEQAQETKHVNEI